VQVLTWVASATFVVPALIWFWPHCARPALTARRAGPLTFGLVGALNVWGMVAAIIQAVLAVTGIGATPILFFVAALPWTLVVGLGYLFDEYGSLVRITGGR